MAIDTDYLRLRIKDKSFRSRKVWFTKDEVEEICSEIERLRAFQVRMMEQLNEINMRLHALEIAGHGISQSET